MKQVRLRKRGQDDEWIVWELRGLMRTRNYYRNKHRKTHAKDDWDRYKALRREVNTRIRRAKTEHYRSVCACRYLSKAKVNLEATQFSFRMNQEKSSQPDQLGRKDSDRSCKHSQYLCATFQLSCGAVSFHF